MSDELVTTDVANDPRVRDAMVDLALKSIDWAKTEMLTGTPQNRALIARTLLPAIARAMGKQEAGDDDALDEFRAMLEEQRKATP